MRAPRTLNISRGVASGEAQVVLGPEPFHSSWDWNGQRLVLTTDRHGLQPVFYRASGDRFAISSSIEALRRPGDELDWSALGLFLRLGFFIGNDVPFLDIHRAPPDSVLQWEDGQLSVAFNRRAAVRAYDGSRQNAEEQYIELFRDSLRNLVEHHAREPIACPLSGGRDSRHIFLELARMGVPFRAFSVDLDSANDATVAAAICAQYDVPHTVVPMRSPSLAAARAMNVRTHYATIEHRWMTPMIDAIPMGIVLDGVAGDVLSASRFASEKRLALFRKGALEEIADELLGSDTALKALLQPWLYAKLSRDDAKARLMGELARHVDMPSPIASFVLANRTRRVTSLMSTAVFGDHISLMPFLSDAVFDFLFTLPGEMTVDLKLHDEALAQAFPECRHPLSQKAPPAPTRRLMAEAIVASAKWRKIANMNFLLPRLARGAVDGRYSTQSSWLVETPLYLQQIGVGAS